MFVAMSFKMDRENALMVVTMTFKKVRVNEQVHEALHCILVVGHKAYCARGQL